MTTIESPSGFTEEIKYDPESRDYAMYLDGELRGYARSYHEAEVTLDKLVYDLLQSDLHRSASELDGGSGADEIAADVASECQAFRCESCGDVLTPDRIIPYCAACQEAGEAEIAAALAAPVPPELLAAVGRAREQALDEACRLMEQWRAPACREGAPTHTCYGLAANCGKPAAHRVDMHGMVMWLCGWCYADWGGADPAPLTLPQAIALAILGDPAPPVDDGEEDNWGGFRSPRQVGG